MEFVEQYRAAIAAALVGLAALWQFREQIVSAVTPKKPTADDKKLSAFADAISLEGYFAGSGNAAGLVAVRAVFAALVDGGDK